MKLKFILFLGIASWFINSNTFAALRLSNPLPNYGSLSDYKISSNQVWAVYRADANIDNQLEIFSVPVVGGVPAIQLNSPLITDGDVNSFEISPDSANVVYLADQDTNEFFELYRVPINGGAAIKLNSTMQGNGDVKSFQITPNGQRVIYLADQETNEIFELYSIPITGGIPVKLNSGLVLGGDVLSFKISPDSSNVVYVADQETNNMNGMYSVPIGGGVITNLNAPLFVGGDVNPFYFKFTPDSTHVLYLANQDTNTYDLYKVPVKGGQSTNLSPVIDADYMNYDFFISPDGSRVVYQVYNLLIGYSDLYVVSINGGAATPFFGLPGDGTSIFNIQFSPNGNRVIFQADYETVGMIELYSFLIGGGLPIKLNPPLSDGEDVLNFKITSDNSRVVYYKNQYSGPYYGYPLFNVPIAGGVSVELSDPLQDRGVSYYYDDFVISPDNARVIYVGYFDDELYSVPLLGGAITKLNLPMYYGYFTAFNLITNRIIYSGRHEASSFELFSRSYPIDGSGYDSTPAPASTINFGSISLGNTATQILVVSEIGTVDLQVDGGLGMLSGSHPSNFQLINGPSFTIPNGGANRTIQILCTPSASGTRTATLSFETTDPTRPVVTYNLQATGTSAGAVPSIAFSSGNYGVTEGNAGTQNLVLTVNRLGATGSPIVFTYSTSDGSAVATNDYVNVIDQQITMGSSQTSTNITVAIVGDTMPEPGAPETFTISLDVISGANLGNPSTTTISITDNDMVIGGDTNVIAITGGLTVLENNAVGVSFNIARLVTDTNAFTVSYSIGGTATNNVDYTLSPQIVSFGSNEVFKLVTVIPINDTNIEGNETVILSLVPGQGYLITNSPDATITILDDESDKLENGDFNGDGFSDILMQKKDTVSLLSGGSEGSYKLADTVGLASKNNKVIAANQVNGTNYLVLKIGRNFQVNAYNKTLSLSKSTPTFKLPKEAGSKVLASGDVNEDGIIDLISTKRGSGTVTFGPNYTDSSTLSDETALLDIDKNRLKSLGSIRGLYQSSGTNILVFQKGKKKPVWLGVLNVGTNSNTEVIINEFKTGFIPEGKIMGFSAANAIYYKKGIVTAGGLSYTNKPAINNLGKPVGPK